LRLREVAAELILEHAVDALDLLLLAQLDAVADELLLARLSVLPRHEVPLFDGAFLRVAALALEEQLHPLAAAQAADRSNVSSHSVDILVIYESTNLRIYEFHFRIDQSQSLNS